MVCEQVGTGGAEGDLEGVWGSEGSESSLIDDGKWDGECIS